MKFNKQIAIILVLLSMLVSAVAISYYLYSQKQDILKNNNQLVTIFVAKDNIKKDTKITEKHIKETTVARQYILTKPLLKKEILNKFAKESIYKNEGFLKEKLSTKIHIIVEKKTLDFKYNSYNMAFKLFKNANYSLEPNDIIKIISVYPLGSKKESNNFSVQYVAKDIKVLGFLNAGKPTEKTIIKKRIKKIVKKKQVDEIIELRSEDLILDIKEEVLLSLINDYNKGKQLWMVKSKLDENKIEEPIEKLIKKDKKKTIVKRKYIPKFYPVKWYKPNSSVSTKTATIQYSDNTDFKESKSAKIVASFEKECSNTNKLLLVKSSKAYLRKHPSIRAKIHKKVHKNYILPYTNISKINTSWYVLCDGSYVQSKNVKNISYSDYEKLRK